MRTAGFVIFALVTISGSSAQVPRLVPDIAVAEAEYRDAQAAWMANDPDLEKDLYRVNPEEMRGRIRRAAALRDTVMVKKSAYLGMLVQRLQGMKTRLDQGALGTLPAEQLKQDLEAQQSRLLDDQERLEALMRDLPQGDEYLLVRRSLEAERTELIGLQNNVAMRIRTLSAAAKAQTAVDATAKPDQLNEKLESVMKIWEAERASAARQRTTWAEIYKLMEKSLDGKPGEAVGAQPLGRAPVTAARPAPKVRTWVYQSLPNAWTGYGEPQDVTLQLSGEDSALTGSYAGRLPVRGGTSQVNLILKGNRQGDTATLRWTSLKPPADGVLKLKFNSDGRVLVERTESSDSFIPRGMEVLSPRP